MLNRNKEKERDERRAELDAESEKQSPGWVQKYLDLADILMRRRKPKRDDDHPKAA
jgi:hypothetical protein